MADTLNIYKGGEVVGSAERGENGKASVTINNLEANTDYEVGTYQVAFSNENGESEKVDVPAFKTKPIAVTGVTLSKENLTLEPGAKGSAQATVQPSNATNKGVKFTSNNEAVATVDGKGEITAKTEGSADITVTTVDGGKTAKLKLTVKKAVINVTGVTVEPKTAKLDIGGTQQLTATVAPTNASDKTVTYTTKSPGIATVSVTGLITAKAEGKAQIVATTKDGAKTAVCDVTVNAPEELEPEPIAVTGVTIAPKAASVDVDATTKLNSTVAPSTATNKSVSYKSSDEEVATVSSNGTVTGVAKGEAKITVTTQDGNKSDTATVTVNAAE